MNTALAKGEAPKKWWEEAMRKGIRFRKALNQKSKLFKTLNAQEINEKSEQELMDNLSYWKMEETDDWHGFKGIAKKIMIFIVVGIGNLCDAYLIKGDGTMIRTAIIFVFNIILVNSWRKRC